MKTAKIPQVQIENLQALIDTFTDQQSVPTTITQPILIQYQLTELGQNLCMVKGSIQPVKVNFQVTELNLQTKHLLLLLPSTITNYHNSPTFLHNFKLPS